jgi:hypothetical protein
VTLTVQGGTSAALDLKVDKDAVTAAATRVVANMLAAGDAQPAWRVLGSGQMEWGAGGATAPDVTLSRGAAGTLYLGSTAQRGALRQFGGATTDVLSDFRVTTDANARWSVQADGRMFWGPGNAAQDVNLYRSGAATIRTDNNFTVGNFATFLNIAAVTRSLPADCLYIKATGDAQPRISLVNSPRIDFGAGGSTAVDTNLYRGAADRLKTDDLFDATTLALATKVKAGTPVDADWAVAPPDGTIVADSTGNKLWVRVGGVWKGVVVA